MRISASKVLLFAVACTYAASVHAADNPPKVWGTEEVLPRRHLGPEARAGYLAAATFLQQRLLALRTYPHIRKRCLAFELEDIEDKSYYFAARGVCSSSPSSLLQRYRVDMETRRAFLFDELKESYQLLPQRRAPTASK